MAATRRSVTRYRPSSQSWGSSIRRAGSFALSAVRSYRRYGGGARTRTGQRSSDPAPVTTQFDSRTTYRKRRMPYRKKRKWIKHKRSVNAVIDSRLATNVLHIRRVASNTRNVAVNTQAAIALECFDRTDLNELAVRVAALQPDLPGLPTTAATGTQKYVIVGDMLTTLLKNTSAETAYLDVYYYRVKRDVPIGEFATIDEMWESGFTYNQANYNVTNNSGGSSLRSNDVGVTPWANPAMRKFVEIYRKRRIRLPGGADTELSMRQSKNRYIGGDMFLDQKSMIRGLTHGMLIVIRGTPNNTASSAAIGNIAWTRERTIYYKVLQHNVQTAGELANA